MTHPLRSRARAGSPAWPSYRGVAQVVGTSPQGRAAIYVDPSLGAEGLASARALLADADRVSAANDAIFGVAGQPVSVIVFALGGATDGTGGADHMGCDFATGGAIEVDAAFGAPARVSALFEAELSECAMGGRLCGLSTGEALSRRCAASVSGDALADFATAPAWAQAGYPNFVSKIDPTDQNAVSTGCGMAFLSWLIGGGRTLADIARAMVAGGDGASLADLYVALGMGAKRRAWPAFMAAVKALPGPITSDDPFG